MAKINTLQERKDQADQILSKIEQTSSRINENFNKSKQILSEINSSDKTYNKLIGKLKNLTASANNAISLYQIEKVTLIKLLKQVNTFYNNRYLPLVDKIENKEHGFTAIIKKGSSFKREIDSIERSFNNQYVKIKKEADRHKLLLRSLVNLESSIRKIFQTLQENEADSIHVLNSINEAVGRVKEFENKVTRYHENSQSFEATISSLHDKSKLSFEKISNIQIKSEKTFQDILNIYEIAADTGRSGEFDKRRKTLSLELLGWRKRIFWCTFVLFACVIGLFIFQLGMDKWILKDLTADANFYIRFALTSPLIYLIYFASTQYSNIQKLVDKYSFKTTLAMSIHSHLELLSNNSKFNKDNYINDILKFTLRAMESIYNEPYSDDDLKMKLKLANLEFNIEKTLYNLKNEYLGSKFNFEDKVSIQKDSKQIASINPS